MEYPEQTPARAYDKGMGEAVANRTVNRKIERPNPRSMQIEIPRRDDLALDDDVAAYCKSKDLKINSYHVDKGDGEVVEITLSVAADVVVEDWADVAHRVSFGNCTLIPSEKKADFVGEFKAMHHHLRQASILMSGRHLQHGDPNQASRNIEVFTNCSTSAMTWLQFYLLLNGSGVGRCYDDEIMLTDWRQMPTVVCVIDGVHKDVTSGEIAGVLDARNAAHLYLNKRVHTVVVEDSREGWAHAVETVETMTYAGCYRNDVLIIDFSKVRPRGSPIGGMQDRPASGPGPIMDAINSVAALRDAGMEPWRATMYADHYFAECVLVGGARRAARMATKFWRDKSIFDFIELKRGGFLWTSNNSVMVDMEFWDGVKFVKAMLEAEQSDITDKKAFHDLIGRGVFTDDQILAWKVLTALTYAAYHDKTGEPGIITVERLTWDGEGSDVLLDGEFAESHKIKLSPDSKKLARALAHVWGRMKYKVITNPCGEIVLNLLGAYCVIADVVPFHAGMGIKKPPVGATAEAWIDYWHAVDADAEDAFKVTTRALIRTNLMDSMYGKEVARTNRIGVGMTGLHEYAWDRFGYGFRDIIDEDKSLDFWLTIARFKRAVKSEARLYAEYLGVAVPHTDTTMKPAGTTSKLFGLTEGAHLASMRWFMRWVQFANNDPLVEVYRAKGYPIMELKVYKGMTVVGFPTVPTICTLGMGDKLVTAAEATPEEQYQFLRLMEKYWIVGVEEDGVTPLHDSGNQVSYTLKYDPKVVSYPQFMDTLINGQSTVRCCSVMPQEDTSAYEYLPEQPVTKAEYELISAAIQSGGVKEDVGFEHVGCGTGGCPVSFGENVSA